MSNIGRIIQDCCCNGFAGRDYDMEGAVIIAEADSWIVCRKESGQNIFISFQGRSKQVSENGVESFAFHTRSDKQELIDKWCSEQD